ncbi:MAG: fatty acid metabolism transcriptional regulator FadR [Anaerolineae bacterium]
MKDSIQEQLIVARRNQILDAAVAVFAQKGFHPTTVKDVAREAGIADGTIYNYFKNKTALLLGIFERMQASVQQGDTRTSLEAMDVRTFMHVFLSQPLVALRTDNFELFRVIVSEMMVNDELRTLYQERILQPTIASAEQVLQQWVENGAIKPVDVGLTVRALSGMVMGLMIESILGDALLEAKWDELPNFLTDLLMDGLEH